MCELANPIRPLILLMIALTTFLRANRRDRPQDRTARAENREMDSEPAIRFVTGSLKVDYLRPTPLGPELELRGTVKEIKPRKVVVAIDLLADGEVCVRGEVIAVRLPENWGQ